MAFRMASRILGDWLSTPDKYSNYTLREGRGAYVDQNTPLHSIFRVHKAKPDDNVIYPEFLSLILIERMRSNADGDIEGVGIELEIAGVQARHFLCGNNCIPSSLQKHHIAEGGCCDDGDTLHSRVR